MNKKLILNFKNKYIFIGNFRKNKLKKDRQNIKNKCYDVLLKRHYNIYYVHSIINKLFPKFLIKNGIKNTIFLSTESFINLNKIKNNENFDFNMVIFNKRVILFKNFNNIVLKNNIKIIKRLNNIMYQILFNLLYINKKLI